MQAIKSILKKNGKEVKTHVYLTPLALVVAGLSAPGAGFLLPWQPKNAMAFPRVFAPKTLIFLGEPQLLETWEEPSCLYETNVKWAPPTLLFIVLDRGGE